MDKMKIAIIGCGTIANGAHIPSYIANKEAEIKYFCDIIPERAEAAVKKYGCGVAITDYREIINSDVDAVSVCTPNNVHGQITMDFLKAGKHVLCEKPVATTYKEALEMQKVQHETGKVLVIGVKNRFNTGVNIIKNMIDRGELGEVYHVYVSFREHRQIPGLGGAFTTKDIAGGGALIDWGVHFLDIVMYCCGDPEPLTVSGETFCKLGKNIKEYAFAGEMWAGPVKYDGIYDVEEAVTGLVRTTGPVITLNGAWAQNIGNREMFIDFIGDKAGIRLIYGEDFKIYSFKDGILLETTPKYTSTNDFQVEIDSFIRSIKAGEKLASHIDTAIITAKMMQAIYDSADAHREVVLGGDSQ